MTFSIEELIAALTAASEVPPPEGAFTVKQICAATKQSSRVVYRNLRRLIADGVIECVRIPQTRIDGVEGTIPAYRLVERTEN